ncbi:MAG: hypothetical protein WC675_03995 [Patescibacteria group bacterium]|jgi:hypothetical protein
MLSKKTLFLGIIVVLTLVLFGCGKSLGQKAAEKYVETKTGANININDEETTIKDKDGNIISVKSNNTLPEGWPSEVPYYQNGTIENSSVLDLPGGRSFTMAINTNNSQEEIINYYKEAFAAAGWEKQMDSTVNGNTVLVFKKDKWSATVGTSIPEDKTGFSIIQTLILGE